MASSALLPNGSFAPRYTCRGGNVSIPVKWAGVAPTAKELVLWVHSYVTLRQATYNWTVAGISPSLQQVEAGKLPPGAIVGRNSFGHDGYDLCLVKGASHMLVVVDVFALPSSVSLKPGFDPATVLNEVRSPAVAWGSALGTIGTPGPVPPPLH